MSPQKNTPNADKEIVRITVAAHVRRIRPSLTVEQFHRLLRHPLIAREPCRTMVLLAACTGLRRGELFALKWRDVDWEKGAICVREIVRSMFDSVPLSPRVADALFEWKQRSPFNRPDDLVFASPFSGGKFHYSPFGIQKDLKRAGVDIGFGIVSGEAVDNLVWHSFRSSYRTWLDITGASISVQQILMRIAGALCVPLTPSEVLESDKREANSKVVDLVMPTEESDGQKQKEMP